MDLSLPSSPISRTIQIFTARICNRLYVTSTSGPEFIAHWICMKRAKSREAATLKYDILFL